MFLVVAAQGAWVRALKLSRQVTKEGKLKSGPANFARLLLRAAMLQSVFLRNQLREMLRFAMCPAPRCVLRTSGVAPRCEPFQTNGKDANQTVRHSTRLQRCFNFARRKVKLSDRRMFRRVPFGMQGLEAHLRINRRWQVARLQYSFLR